MDRQDRQDFGLSYAEIFPVRQPVYQPAVAGAVALHGNSFQADQQKILFILSIHVWIRPGLDQGLG